MKPSLALRHFLYIASSTLLAISYSHAGNTWDGGGANDNWSTNANWNSDTAPGYGTLTFAGSTRTTNIVDVNYSMNTLLWTGSSAWTLNNSGGSVVSLFDNGGTQAKIENQSTGLVTINAPIDFAATSGAAWGEINAVNGNITFGSGGTINVSGSAVNELRFYGSGRTVTINCVLTAGARKLVIGPAITDNNTVILNNANSYSGNTEVNVGSVQVGNNTGLGTSAVFLGNGGPTFANLYASLLLNTSGLTVSNNITTNKADTGGGLGTGTRSIGGNFTSGTSTYSGTVTLNGGAVLTAGTGGTVNFTNVIADGVDTGNVSRAITIRGGGTIVLSATNTYTGTTTIAGGTLQLGDGTTGSLAASNALTFTGGTGTFNVSQAAGGSQSMGTLTLSGGAATVQSTYAGSGNTSLTFSNVAARTAGATANFVTSGGTNGTTNKIVLTNFGGSPTPTGTLLDRGIFFGGTRYASYNAGGYLEAFTGGTAAATAANVTDTTGTFNYDVAAVGTLGAGANINTLRYTGAAGTIAGALTTRGILNASGNALVFSGAITGGSGELVVNTASGNIQFSATTGVGAYDLVKTGSGRLELSNAAQLYTGKTIVNGGVLSYGDTSSYLSAANITLNGGVIDQRWNTIFTRTLGSGAGQIQLLGGDSGLSNNNGGHTVRFNNNAATEVVWGSTFFNPSTLVLQSAFTQNNTTLTMDNTFDLNGSTRTIQVNPGIGGASSATFAQAIRTTSGTAGIIKTGGGILNLNGVNTYNGGTTINEGIVLKSDI